MQFLHHVSNHAGYAHKNLQTMDDSKFLFNPSKTGGLEPPILIPAGEGTTKRLNSS
ncbi:hypothetical protein [Xanthomonas theicola]|uniref:hypothetical protein n=1 Tax=Xanthomonas theicola TaxID=56464 RepID=UPI001304DE35|nr:hypothetical protein [Xanthomonas theicola]